MIWTKPEDMTFDPKGPLPKLGGHFSGGFNAALYNLGGSPTGVAVGDFNGDGKVDLAAPPPKTVDGKPNLQFQAGAGGLHSAEN